MVSDLKTFKKSLVEQGVISAEELRGLELAANEQKRDFFDVACDNARLSAQITAFFTENAVMGVFLCSGAEARGDLPVHLITADFARKHMVLPLSASGGKLAAAFSNPFNPAAYEELEMLLPYGITPVYTPWRDMKILLNKYYGAFSSAPAGEGAPASAAAVKEAERDIAGAPAVKTLRDIIASAVLANASDIHIEPCLDYTRVRFRVDGRLSERERVAAGLHAELVSRLKFLSNLDISEKRLPQDGRFIETVSGTRIDFRVGTVAAQYGEKATIRLLYEKKELSHKSALGFSPEAQETIDAFLSRSHGAILLTGPTGSGKSTTMAAFLRELNKNDTNIITVEDPVENVIHGVTQINVNPKAGFGFAQALRSILRHDPDVLMVGEIRDADTARLTVQSALTGHLVLSTLHTFDSLGAIHRLMEMGVSDYLVFSAVKAVISQRLVRRLCGACKKKAQIAASDAYLLNVGKNTEVCEGAGCESCNFTGYSGRFAVYEILPVGEPLIEKFIKKTGVEQIKRELTEQGFETLRKNGLKRVLSGDTSVFEFKRAVFG